MQRLKSLYADVNVLIVKQNLSGVTMNCFFFRKIGKKMQTIKYLQNQKGKVKMKVRLKLKMKMRTMNLTRKVECTNSCRQITL